jgi:hypothetical protein
VFAIDIPISSTKTYFESGFPVDLALSRWNFDGINTTRAYPRLTTGRRLHTNTTDAETTVSPYEFDHQDKVGGVSISANNDIAWMFKRAPGFFDVVAYTGNGTAGRTVSHNLGVAPEMMWVKNRETATNWLVYHKDVGNTKGLYLDESGAPITVSWAWNDTTPTESVFTVGSGQPVNENAHNLIAYLFASLPGISKIGSYTGNGTSQTIDCGFSTGARFFLVKASSTTGDWHVFDTERGIVSGNDPYLELNTTNAEDTDEDAVDPVSSGIIVNETSGSNINTNGVTYIYMAIS